MSKSFRETRQRNAIIDALRQHGNPMTAKQIRDAAAQSVPSLGIATVYRNIRHLLQENEIEQINVPGLTSYFSLPCKKPLTLAVCRKSEQVTLIDSDQLTPAALKGLASLPSSFEVEDIELFIFGQFSDAQAPATAEPVAKPAARAQTSGRAVTQS